MKSALRVSVLSACSKLSYCHSLILLQKQLQEKDPSYMWNGKPSDGDLLVLIVPFHIMSFRWRLFLNRFVWITVFEKVLNLNKFLYFQLNFGSTAKIIASCCVRLSGSVNFSKHLRFLLTCIVRQRPVQFATKAS